MILYTVDILDTMWDGDPLPTADTTPFHPRGCCTFCGRAQAQYRHARCGINLWLCRECYVALRDLGKILPVRAVETLENATRDLDDRDLVTR